MKKLILLLLWMSTGMLVYPGIEDRTEIYGPERIEEHLIRTTRIVDWEDSILVAVATWNMREHTWQYEARRVVRISGLVSLEDWPPILEGDFTKRVQEYMSEHNIASEGISS